MSQFMQYHPEKNLKCICPTLTQQYGVTELWSGEEALDTNSGYWFLLCGLPPPRRTPHKLAAPWDASLSGQHNRFASKQSPLPQHVPMGTGPRTLTQSTLFVSSGMLIRMNHPAFLFLGYSFSPPKPLCLCLSPAPCSHQLHIISGTF